ncbi:hypothetical protein HLI01_22255 [Rhizobium laguerreae]|uniref:spike base protein, RCAP_Rcc01079 family n=1 Tax=Rhizobium laguerreae TaxID=1076926 RepID=UPI001478EBC7|nr:hypothetical protein [Rhizobium laguerreae]NNH59461.1 hypothetical protein [Rhizobium laguerreae]
MAATDLANRSNNVVDPASNAAAVTPNDSTDLTYTSRAIYIGGAGNLAVIMAGGQTVTFTGVLAGAVIPIRASRVMSTNTTATSIVAVW